MEIDGFQLETAVKLERAQMNLKGDASDADLLVEYDRLGGLITRAGQKVKTGCFYDSKTRKAFAKPKVIFIYSVNGHNIEVPEGSELPGEVRAANILAAEEKKTAKKTAAKKPADPTTEEDTEEGEDEE